MTSVVAQLPECEVASQEAEPFVAAQEGVAGKRDEVLASLMSEHGEEIYRHCEQVLGDPDLAADVHQLVFVQAHRDLLRFEGRASYRTWLFSIARHRCLDAIKARKRRRSRFVLRAVLPDTEDVRADIPLELDRRREEQAMGRALLTLKPKVRIAVLLRYREDMSYEDMADVCGERAATLQARVARALPKLKAALAELERGGIR